CSTIAWPPSWNAPSSKLARVRSEALKNTSAIALPARASPMRRPAPSSRLNRAAPVSSASSSARPRSWVLRKCVIGGKPDLLERRKPREVPWKTEKPGEGRAFLGNTAVLRITQRFVGIPVGAHARSSPRPCGQRSGRGRWRGGASSGGHRRMRRGVAQDAGSVAVVLAGGLDGHLDPQLVSGVVRQPRAVLLAAVDVVHVVGDRAPELAFDRHHPAARARLGRRGLVAGQRILDRADDPGDPAALGLG